MYHKGRYDTIWGGAGDSENVTLQIILRDVLRPLLLPFRRSTARARRIRECTELEYSKPHMIAHWAKDQRLFTGPSTPELRPSIKSVLPAGIQQAPLPAVTAREHKTACIFDFGFCEATVTPNG